MDEPLLPAGCVPEWLVDLAAGEPLAPGMVAASLVELLVVLALPEVGVGLGEPAWPDGATIRS